MGWHAAVLGSSAWGRLRLAALTASPHVDRVTLVGRDPRRLASRAAEFPILRATSADARRVLDDPGINLVDVFYRTTSTPTRRSPRC